MSHVIPKRKVAVRMRLTDGSRVEGEVFLDFIDPVHRGEQTLLDMFNKDALWFPVGGEDGVRVVNRSQVLTVEPGPGVEPGLVRRDSDAVFRRERVSLQIGEQAVSGLIAMDLPDEFSRVSDFLNFPDDFFAVETEAGPVLVAKAQVTALTPHESPPAVPATDSGLEDRI
ncbi:MAG: hypothetical protein HKN12_08715 [Gemmatimonadetes bacterium]|nr:hypothetical protein [Gemmatimonadota bacterium]